MLLGMIDPAVVEEFAHFLEFRPTVALDFGPENRINESSPRQSGRGSSNSMALRRYRRWKYIGGDPPALRIDGPSPGRERAMKNS